MPTEHRVRVLIIGSGPAGYTAAIYAARANLAPLLVQGLQPGGQLTITTEIENYPGAFPAPQGPELMETMRQQAEHVGARMAYDIIVEADLSKRPFAFRGDSGDTYVADAVVIATGAQARWLGIPSEERYNGRGVSACATCDGFFYRGKPVVVVGGGNSAVEEALYLSGICSSVTVVHRRDSFRCEPVLRDRLAARPNVSVVWNSVVEEILGEDGPTGGVTGVRLRNAKSGEESQLACDGVFVAIGHSPATALFRGQVDLDPHGYIVVQPGTAQVLWGGGPLRGAFAAGDVADPVWRQAITAAGMGCMAALSAQRLLESEQV